MLPALSVFPRVELEPVGQKEKPLGWDLEKMALHLSFILHSIRVSQGLCLGWPGAKCVLMVCQNHAGSVETQARGGTVSEAHPQHLAASIVPAQGQCGTHMAVKPSSPALHAHTVSREDTWGQTASSEQAEGRVSANSVSLRSELGPGACEAREGPELRSLHRATAGVRPALASPGLL